MSNYCDCSYIFTWYSIKKFEKEEDILLVFLYPRPNQVT